MKVWLARHVWTQPLLQVIELVLLYGQANRRVVAEITQTGTNKRF